jgi:hypothetical protein
MTQDSCCDIALIWTGVSKDADQVPRKQEITVAQNHYTTKTKRRQKNGKRKDPSAATMAALRKLEAAAAKTK